MKRYAARRDANEPDIINAARRIGLKVFVTNELGDLIVQFGTPPNCITSLVEVKTELGKLTPAQCKRKQQGLHAVIVRTVDDILALKKWMMKKVGA